MTELTYKRKYMIRTFYRLWGDQDQLTEIYVKLPYKPYPVPEELEYLAHVKKMIAKRITRASERAFEPGGYLS
jgi:hypothetical protein